MPLTSKPVYQPGVLWFRHADGEWQFNTRHAWTSDDASHKHLKWSAVKFMTAITDGKHGPVLAHNMSRHELKQFLLVRHRDFMDLRDAMEIAVNKTTKPTRKTTTNHETTK